MRKRCSQYFHRTHAIGYGACIARGMVRLGLDRSLDGDKTEAEASLKKRMFEFLSGVTAWMLSGLS